ncbi:hypothetical protein ACLKA6_008347 [Drosophila palustris]
MCKTRRRLKTGDDRHENIPLVCKTFHKFFLCLVKSLQGQGFRMQTNVQIDSKNLRSNDDNFRSRSHHITIETLMSTVWCRTTANSTANIIGTTDSIHHTYALVKGVLIWL